MSKRSHVCRLIVGDKLQLPNAERAVSIAVWLYSPRHIQTPGAIWMEVVAALGDLHAYDWAATEGNPEELNNARLVIGRAVVAVMAALNVFTEEESKFMSATVWANPMRTVAKPAAMIFGVKNRLVEVMTLTAKQYLAAKSSPNLSIENNARQLALQALHKVVYETKDGYEGYDIYGYAVTLNLSLKECAEAYANTKHGALAKNGAKFGREEKGPKEEQVDNES